jgi:hypothetical protein
VIIFYYQAAFIVWVLIRFTPSADVIIISAFELDVCERFIRHIHKGFSGIVLC